MGHRNVSQFRVYEHEPRVFDTVGDRDGQQPKSDDDQSHPGHADPQQHTAQRFEPALKHVGDE